MNRSFTENSRRIKDAVKIEDYLKTLGIEISYGNRCDCVICKGRKGKMAIDKEKQKVTCFGGCIKYGDIIDLHAILNNLNHIESLNDLIKIYSIDRAFSNNYKPIAEEEREFKAKAKGHLDTCIDELDKISLLKYELLEQFQCIEYCYYLKDTINEKKDDLSYNKYNKEEIRHLYKKTVNFINKIKLLERNN